MNIFLFSYISRKCPSDSLMDISQTALALLGQAVLFSFQHNGWVYSENHIEKNIHRHTHTNELCQWLALCALIFSFISSFFSSFFLAYLSLMLSAFLWILSAAKWFSSMSLSANWRTALIFSSLASIVVINASWRLIRFSACWTEFFKTEDKLTSYSFSHM